MSVTRPGHWSLQILIKHIFPIIRSSARSGRGPTAEKEEGTKMVEGAQDKIGYLIGVVYLLEVRCAVVSIADIRVILEREAPISFLDLVSSRARADSQSRVRIPHTRSRVIRHRYSPCFPSRT